MIKNWISDTLFILTAAPIEVGCSSDDECSSQQACIGRSCVNPCTYNNPCSPSATCTVSNHKALCTCPPGTTGDPYQRCEKRELTLSSEFFLFIKKVILGPFYRGNYISKSGLLLFTIHDTVAFIYKYNFKFFLIIIELFVLQQKLVTVILILNVKTIKHALCINAQHFVGPETHVEEMLNAKPWGIVKFADVQ